MSFYTEFRFEPDALHKQVNGSDHGFQEFIKDLSTSEWAGLKTYAGGRDGAIDLRAPFGDDGGQVVVECKYIGSKDDAPARARSEWNAIKGRLRIYLGQNKPGAYAPWSSTEKPVVTYVFWVSCRLVTANQDDNLESRIKQDFATLAADLKLPHLAQIKVEVRDAQSITDRLPARPDVAFRWFKAARPVGAVPLGERKRTSTFADFLDDATLPYYRLTEHAAAVGASYQVEDEDAMLDSLGIGMTQEDHDATGGALGLLLTGRGGVGKTRLMLELGRMLDRKGWCVLTVNDRAFTRDLVDAVVERTAPEAGVVFLVDYAETQATFGTAAAQIESHVAARRGRLRWIANCRTTAAEDLRGISSQREIKLTPQGGQSGAWRDAYRRAVVNHILRAPDLEGEELEKARVVCGDVPVVAVFMAYLARRGKDGDRDSLVQLRALLSDGDFARWLDRRASGFKSAGPLASLMPHFPLDEAQRDHLREAGHKPTLDFLLTEGWVTPGPEDESGALRFQVVHDVVADLLLVRRLEDLGAGAADEVRDLLRQAERWGTLRSVLTALGRISEQDCLDGIRWGRVVSAGIKRAPEPWAAAVDVVAGSHLLQTEEQLTLLEDHAALFLDTADDAAVINMVAWLARRVVKTDAGPDRDRWLPVLRTWSDRLAKGTTEGWNFTLTAALLLNPDGVRDQALAWIEQHPLEFQTHYLLKAWLTSGLPPEAVEGFVRDWAEAYQNTFHLTHLVGAWCKAANRITPIDAATLHWLGQRYRRRNAQAQYVLAAWPAAGGPPGAVKAAVAEWLDVHATEPEAQFVYTAWLDATHDGTFVRAHVADWLKLHAAEPKASHVYKAWLNATHDGTFVKAQITDWLKLHAAEPEAQFVYNAWLDATHDGTFVKPQITDWLKQHATEPEARFVYKAWLDATHDGTFVKAQITDWLKQHATEPEARFVYKGWLDATHDCDHVAPALQRWLSIPSNAARFESSFVYCAWLSNGGNIAVVEDAAMDWLAHYHDRPEAVFLTKEITRSPHLPPATAGHILRWCALYPDAPDGDALFRLSRIAPRCFHRTLAEPLREACMAIWREWVLPGHQVHLTTALDFACLVLDTLASWVPGIGADADSLIVQWLRHPGSFNLDFEPSFYMEFQPLTRCIARLVREDQLDPVADAASLARFRAWLERWDADVRGEALRILDAALPTPARL